MKSEICEIFEILANKYLSLALVDVLDIRLNKKHQLWRGQSNEFCCQVTNYSTVAEKKRKIANRRQTASDNNNSCDLLGQKS
jgi:hypothetical protein